MRNKFDSQLSELNKEMIEMGNKIMESIKASIEAMVNRDEEKAEAIMENDAEIDHLQKKIENSYFNNLIHQQTVGKNLRTVTAGTKTGIDME